jgi:hypothetical protein
MNNLQTAVILRFCRPVVANLRIMKSYRPTLAFVCLTFGFCCLVPSSYATSNYTYKPGEYVVVKNGRSPNGQYSIATHGEGELGYDHFHVYLMDARTGKKIGPLEEIQDTLDTGADAFNAQWSADSREVSINYRVDRHVAVKIRYRIEGGRASRISGPSTVK